MSGTLQEVPQGQGLEEEVGRGGTGEVWRKGPAGEAREGQSQDKPPSVPKGNSSTLTKYLGIQRAGGGMCQQT